jgi:tRNA-2-methylthio-N6-dimethylallyladenosine synthase
VPIGATIVDIAEEAGSQNTIRDHVLPEKQVGGCRLRLHPAGLQHGLLVLHRAEDPRRRALAADGRHRGRVRALAERGVREITLLGQIVTSYGRRDYAHTGGVSPFVQLLERVHAIDGIARIRFTSPHPRGFKDDLSRPTAVCRSSAATCTCRCRAAATASCGDEPALHARALPGDRGRPARGAPDMYFSTDVIVGFPGETEEEFAQTRALFEACNYDMAYIFKYSVRTGTPAADMATRCPTR